MTHANYTQEMTHAKALYSKITIYESKRLFIQKLSRKHFQQLYKNDFDICDK